MKKYLLILTTILINTSINLFGTHTISYEYYYQWKSDSTYEINLIFYRNCQGFTAGAPSYLISQFRSDSLGLMVNANLLMLPTVGSNVPPLMPPNLFTCVDLLTVCAEEYHYRGTVTLPARARDWESGFTLCCIPTENDNMNASQPMYVNMGINNLDFPHTKHQNNSPIWHTRRPSMNYPPSPLSSYPIISVCEYRDYTFDMRAREFQGDSVVHTMIRPLTGNVTTSIPINYKSPYDSIYVLPFDSSKPFDIVANTGEFHYSPVAPPAVSGSSNMFLLAFRADEYRYDSFVVNGNMVWEARRIGFVMRYLTVYTSDSSLCPDKNIGIDSLNSIPNFNCGNPDWFIPLTAAVTCASIDTNGSFIELYSIQSSTPIPVKRAFVNQCDGFSSDSVFFQPDVNLDSGRYYVVLKPGGDGNTLISSCGKEIPAYRDTFYFDYDTVRTGKILGKKYPNGLMLDKLVIACGTPSFNVDFSEPFLCNSISVLNSEFYAVDRSVVPNKYYYFVATTPKCKDRYVDQVTFSSIVQMPPGLYEFHLKKGTDGNTLSNGCGAYWKEDSILMRVNEIPFVDLGNDKEYCEGETIFRTFSVSSQYKTYNWSTGATGISSITVNDTGTYSVYVEDYNGCYAQDTVVLTYIDCYVGNHEFELDNVRLYPNPTNNDVYIEYNTIEMLKVDIYDIYGIFQMKDVSPSDNGKIDISDFNSGVYFFKVTVNDRSKVFRLVKR